MWKNFVSFRTLGPNLNSDVWYKFEQQWLYFPTYLLQKLLILSFITHTEFNLLSFLKYFSINFCRDN